jgi:hypothetical protein
MTSYREEINKYKAKREGIVDAKVVAPKGRKKKVDKPWVVYIKYHTPLFSKYEPYINKFEHEHDARSYLRKESGFSSWKTVWLEYNGEKVE